MPDMVRVHKGKKVCMVPREEWELMRSKKMPLIQCIICFKLMWDRREVVFPNKDCTPFCIDCAIIWEEFHDKLSG